MCTHEGGDPAAALVAGHRPSLSGRSVTDPLRDELAWLADALGDVRDADVRRARLDNSVDALVRDRPEVDWEPRRVRSALWSPLVAENERAQVVLDEVLTSERYALLLDQLRGLVADPPWTDKASKSIGGAYRLRTRRELDRVHRRMEVALDPVHTPDERGDALHEARKAAKRARYAVEPLRPVYGDAAVTLAKRLKKIQSALGAASRHGRHPRLPPGTLPSHPPAPRPSSSADGRRFDRAREPRGREVRRPGREGLAEARQGSPPRLTPVHQRRAHSCAAGSREQLSRHRFPSRMGGFMAARIEILKDQQGDYQFQVRAKDGEIVAVGQSYPTKARAEQGMLDTLKAVSKAKVYDLTTTESR